MFEEVLALARHGLDMRHEGALPQGRYENKVPQHLHEEVTRQLKDEVVRGWLEEIPAEAATAANAPLLAKQEPNKVRLLLDFSNRNANGNMRGVNALVSDEALPQAPMARPRDLARAVRKLRDRYGVPPVQLVRDLSAAFKRLGVRKEDTHALHIEWEGRHYAALRTPFGHRTSCAATCRLTTAVGEVLTERMGGAAYYHWYVDDANVLCTPQYAVEAEALLLECLADLGLPLSAQKAAQAGPWATTANWIGFSHDTVAETHALTREKQQQLQLELQGVLQAALWAKTVSRIAFRRLVGRLSHAATVFTAGRAFLVPMFEMLQQTGAQLTVTAAARADCAWWAEFLPQMPAVAAMRRPATESDEAWVTDASLTGLGGARYASLSDALAHINPLEAFAMPLEKRHEPKEMMTLEAWAAELAVSRWAHHASGRAVHLVVDNEGLAACITAGRSRAAPANAHLRRTLLHAAKADVQLYSHPVPSAQNGAADALSRLWEREPSQPPPQHAAVLDVLPFTPCPKTCTSAQ